MIKRVADRPNNLIPEPQPLALSPKKYSYDPSYVKKQKRPPVEILSEKELTFPKFVRSDMSKFNAKVIAVQKKVLSYTEYVVEINISNISPPIRRYKRYTEFKAFYKALKLRFANAGWPEFPPRIQFYKKVETRVTAFNRILEVIFETMEVGSTYRKSLLTIFYAFFLEAGLQDLGRKETKNIIYLNLNKKESQSSAQSSEGSDHEDSIQEEVLHMSILNFERQNILDPPEYDDENTEFFDVDETHTQSNSFIGRKSFVEPVHKKGSLSFVQPSKSEPIERDLPMLQDKDKMKDKIVSEEQKSSRTSPILKPVSPITEIKEVKEEEKSEGRSRTPHKRDKSQENIEQRTPRARLSNKEPIVLQRSNSALNKTKSSMAVDNRESEKTIVSAKKSDGLNMTKDYNSQYLIDNEYNKPKAAGKDKGSFSGLIYMRLSSSQKWHPYYAQLVKSKMIVYDNVMVNKPSHFVPCYKCDLEYVEDFMGDYIAISHTNDSEKLYLATSLVSNPRKTMIENNASLDEWYTQLKIAREDATGLDLIDDSYHPIGKLQLIVSGAENLKKLQKNSLYYVNIQHMPFNLKTSPALVEKEKINWNQSFFIPIYDTFFSIKLDLVYRYNAGWIVDKKKDEVIYSGELLMADILSMNSDTILKLNLPINPLEANKKQQPDSLEMSKEKSKSSQPVLNIKLKNLSTYKSFIHPPTKEYIEGVRVYDGQFSRQLLKLGIRRIRRIISYTNSIFNDIDDIFHCKYPYFSYLCILILTHLIMTSDPSNLISILFMLITIYGVYKNPKVEKKVRGFMNIYFFSEEHLNPDYHSPRVQTMKEMIAKKDMQTAKWKYKLVDTDPLLLQYKKAKKSVIAFTVKLLEFSSFFEKLKNILTWHDPIRTMWFIAFTCLAYLVCAVLPFRFLLLLAIWLNLFKGVHFYKRRYLQNLALTKHTLNFITKKYFSNYYAFVSEKPNQPWPTAGLDSFQKKLIRELNPRLELNLADDTLFTFKTPLELISGIATSSKFLKYVAQRNDGPIPQEMKNVVKIGPVSKLMHFIFNVPSDYYRVVHPMSVDLYKHYREKPNSGQVEKKPKMSKARNVEILLIVIFITLYELYLFFNFHLLGADTK